MLPVVSINNNKFSNFLQFFCLTCKLTSVQQWQSGVQPGLTCGICQSECCSRHRVVEIKESACLGFFHDETQNVDVRLFYCYVGFRNTVIVKCYVGSFLSLLAIRFWIMYNFLEYRVPLSVCKIFSLFYNINNCGCKEIDQMIKSFCVNFLYTIAKHK